MLKPVHSRRSGSGLADALTWREGIHRFSFVVFLMLAISLLVVGRTNPAAIEVVRTRAMDGLTPLLDAVARPVDMIESFSARLQSYAHLQEENKLLRSQNAQIARWQNAAVILENENKALRDLLRFKAEPRYTYISARVIADVGGPFVRALVVTAGRADGVREGMAAMTGDGLIGRVIEVSDQSARILLLTDLSFRMPVAIAGSGEHAILAGDNSTQPKLLYLPTDATPANGSRVYTSGHGGVFPPNLPVGTVSSLGRGEYGITPFASMGKISFVTLIDFELAGGAANHIASKIDAELKKN